MGVSILALLTLLVGVRANTLLEAQNRRLEIQNNLLEAQRRSILSQEVERLLAELSSDAALVEDEQGLKVIDPRLEARVVSLTVSLRPYRVLDPEAETDPEPPGLLLRWLAPVLPIPQGPEQRLVDRPLSPERGRILQFLLGMTGLVPVGDIFRRGNFEYADMRGVTLYPRSADDGIFLISMNLRFADFSGAELSRVTFFGTRLAGARFDGTDLGGARPCYFEHASFGGASFVNANLQNVGFNQSWLLDDGADATGANLEGVFIESDKHPDAWRPRLPPRWKLVRHERRPGRYPHAYRVTADAPKTEPTPSR